MSVSPYTAVIPTKAEAVDISSTDHEFPKSTCYGIYVGGTGDVIVTFRDAPTVEITYKAVPVGTVLEGRFLKVIKTNTTASLMVGLLVQSSYQL